LIFRQLNLLSFGEEAAEFESPADEVKKTKMKSTYDFMENVIPTPTELIEELKGQPEPTKSETVVVEKVATIDEKLKEKVKQAAAEEKKKKIVEEKVAATPSEERSSAIEKLKQDIRNISKVQEEEEPVKKKEKKKSLVELEREKYAANQKKKKGAADKEDDRDVSSIHFVNKQTFFLLIHFYRFSIN
jgi:peptidyl-prolyl cis-trans isomerase SDCCAG10